jgi:hypothetical protein
MAIALAMVGCATANPPSGSAAYKDGELGNGGFLFKCDDSVACDRWSTNSAKDFPDQIATGAVFDVRFVANADQGSSTKESPYTGVTAQPVKPYIDRNADGHFATLKPGFGVIAARDSKGTIVDYATIKIVKPDTLVVYTSDYKGSDPPAIDALTMKLAAARKTFRAVAERAHVPLAGSVTVAWSSSAPDIVQVESYSQGVVTVVAKQIGKATLRADGAALAKEIPVEVTP